MRSISLSELNSAAKNKPAGFLEEALKVGNIKSSYIEFSDSDFNNLKNFKSIQKNQQIESVKVSSLPKTDNKEIKL